jgi:hypothetical protein
MSSVAQKLGIASGMTVAVDGQPLTDVRELLGELPADVTVDARTGAPVDQVLLAADGLSDLASMLSGVWDAVSPGGRLWVWYRKGANKARAQASETPLHRDTLQVLLAEHAMDGVTLISVDDIWSAMRVKQR